MGVYRNKRVATPAGRTSSPQGRSRGFWLAAVLVLLGIGAGVFVASRNRATPPASLNTANPARPAASSSIASNDMNTAVMVTVELDFGGSPPSIADALRDIERRHQPDFGTGRVFAILDAYGEPTPDGKKLHMSMHVSMEKPGVGSLLFKRTGEVLWSSRILLSTNVSTFSGNALSILLDDGTGKLFTVDGSTSPSSILDANLKEPGRPVRDLWQDGAEHEVTFIYSACGCPVKVKCRRIGNRTVRTKDMPVIFPDDPAVVGVITRLMGW